ncbi:elongation factor Ts [Candidatus Wolfebacteria bacterium]|nr:elongation factor Ts [Candidatus Wolfebacteria bacterium]
MTVTAEQIKVLREETGISVIQCKKALEAAGGNIEQARAALRKTGAGVALKKAGRSLGSGIVQAYLHAGGTVGAMAELLCETDFVAKNEGFKKLAYEIAMQVAATDDAVLEAGTKELLAQPYIKDPSRTVADLIQDATQKFGERTKLGRVVKFAV